MNKCFVQNNNIVSGPIFSEESVSREIELIENQQDNTNGYPPLENCSLLNYRTQFIPRERILISWPRVSFDLGLEKEESVLR